MKRWYKIGTGDKILIVFLIVSIIGGYIFISFFNEDPDKKNIVIQVDGNAVRTISVNEKTNNKTYDFKFGNNMGYVELKDGKVRMLEMPKSVCPEGICSDTGWISKKYETIVCLPNRIIVTIEQDQEAEVDTVVF